MWDDPRECQPGCAPVFWDFLGSLVLTHSHFQSSQHSKVMCYSLLFLPASHCGRSHQDTSQTEVERICSTHSIGWELRLQSVPLLPGLLGLGSRSLRTDRAQHTSSSSKVCKKTSKSNSQHVVPTGSVYESLQIHGFNETSLNPLSLSLVPGA